MKLDLLHSDLGHQSIIFNGFYELKLSTFFVKLATEGGLLIDVGANYGYFSCLWAGQHPQNQVLAFEPAPGNLDGLENNIDKNHLSGRIEILPIALGKEKGRMRFDIRIENKQTGWGGLTMDNSSNSLEVQVDTLDNYANEHNITSIDLLKIDTEGADTWVLYGAENLLKQKKIKHIFFEHNFGRMKDLQIERGAAREFLEKCGYVVESVAMFDFHSYPKK